MEEVMTCQREHRSDDLQIAVVGRALMRDRVVRRIAVALCIALLVGYATWRIEPFTDTGPDFGQIWYAAREVLARRNPYLAIGPGRAYNWGYNLYYPLPAVLLAVPFAWLSLRAATAAFIALSSGLLAFAVTRDNWVRLPLFLSTGAFIAAAWGQWSFIIAAAALMPSLGLVLAAKPTTGLAAFSYRPTIRSAAGVVALVALSFVVQPGWAGDWIAAVHTAVPHFSPTAVAHEKVAGEMTFLAPVSRFGGVLLLLAALRWRRPEARYLLVLAFIPQNMVLYECVLLYIIPATLTESLWLVILSYVAYFGPILVQLAGMADTHHFRVWAQGNWMLTCQYLPCLIMVLRRPNEGYAPARLTRAIGSGRQFAAERWAARRPR